MSVDYTSTAGYGFAVPESALPEHEDGAWEAAEQICQAHPGTSYSFAGSAYDGNEDTVMFFAQATAASLDYNFDSFKEFARDVDDAGIEVLESLFEHLHGRRPDSGELGWILGGYWS